MLMMELVKLRQQQQNTRAYLEAMEQRLQGTEMRQQQMMAFLARAMKNPTFLYQLLQQKKMKELEEAMSKKRRRSIEQAPSSDVIAESSGGVKSEPLEFEDYGFEVSELEVLAKEMQGFRRGRRAQHEAPESSSLERLDNELDEGFWEELFSDHFEGELDINEGEGEDVDVDVNVHVLANRLGYMGSSPN